MGKKKEDWKCIGEHEFDGDIVITDPCYINKSLNWEETNDFMEEHGLISRTFYGDWGCTVFRAKAPIGKVTYDCEKLGEFCADGGMVCVLDMDTVLGLDPDFQKFIDEHGWCVTVINGFKGKVRLMANKEKRFFFDKEGRRVDYEDVELRVRGDGEVNGEKFSFESVQTSL